MSTFGLTVILLTNPPKDILPSYIQEMAGVVPDLVINYLARVLGIDTEIDIDLP